MVSGRYLRLLQMFQLPCLNLTGAKQKFLSFYYICSKRILIENYHICCNLDGLLKWSVSFHQWYSKEIMSHRDFFDSQRLFLVTFNENLHFFSKGFTFIRKDRNNSWIFLGICHIQLSYSECKCFGIGSRSCFTKPIPPLFDLQGLPSSTLLFDLLIRWVSNTTANCSTFYALFFFHFILWSISPFFYMGYLGIAQPSPMKQY